MRCVVVGFHRFFDQNLYILAFFDKKSGQLSTAKQMFHFHSKIKRNVYIWQFLAQKRGRCGKRNLSILLTKICRCVVAGFHQVFDQKLYIFTFFFCTLKKMTRNSYIWQFLAQKRARCSKRNLSISL